MIRNKPCTVGLTGGLASGKSAVAALIAERGIPVLDADAVVHRIYGSGEVGASFVEELFGHEVLCCDGSVDRLKLRDLVVDDHEARHRLNVGIHPLVRSEIGRWLAAIDDPIAVIEAALLVETGGYSEYDVLMVVWCRPDQQLTRAVVRGVPEDVARGLLQAQAPIADKLAVADVVVDNGGPPEDLELEVERGWSEVVGRCRR